MIDTKNLPRLLDFKFIWSPSWNKTNNSYYAHVTIYLGIGEDGKYKSKKLSLQSFLMNPNNDRKIRVDHENYDTLDNREFNLRVTTNDKNLKHRNGKNSNNKSGYRNVFWSTKDERWLVVLQIEGKRKCFGRFKYNDLEKAGVLAEKMRQEHYGAFSGKN